MSLQNGKDYLYLIWKDDKSRQQFIVGELSRNGQFEFQYCEEIDAAVQNGFTPLVCFPELNKMYVSDHLFNIFSSRLPDRKRKDMNKILQKYGLEEYEEYNLLKRSGARLPIDNMEFIDPILDLKEPLVRKFFVAGLRHYLPCNGYNCEEVGNISRGDEVFLRREPDNKFDTDAVQLILLSGDLLGYIPRYYSKGVSKILQQGRKVKCHVCYVDKNKNCNECVKVILSAE